MFRSKNRTVKEVLAPFNTMVEELKAIVTNRQKDIDASKRAIVQAQAEFTHCEAEIAQAQDAQKRLLEIVCTVMPSEEAPVVVPYTWDKEVPA